MADLSQIKDGLTRQFGFLADKIVTPRERRVFVEAPPDKFREVFEYAVKQMGFDWLCTITGLDEKESLVAIYHLAHADGTVLNLKNRVARDKPAIRSVTDVFPGAANYERELVDLLGFEVEGLPPGNRYPLPDGWPTDQHPLRKDWQPEKKAEP
jgi:NADH:ubiquinone oxidoreductase subunit C